MSCKVHHVRFYEPSAVAAHCLALHRDGRSLALSRSDASIEIWSLRGAPRVSRAIPGTPAGSVEALCWVGDRLMSAGLAGQVVEWDLDALAPKIAAPVTGHAAWCMDVAEETFRLAVGTEGGYVNIFSAADDLVRHRRTFDKQEGRILCCKFDPSGQILATGSNETIRIWNVETGQALHRMITGRSQAKKETIVWCLAVTADLTVISGDSRGHLTFWDARQGEQIESVNTHKADVLSICLSEDEQTVSCAGVDPLIASFTKVKMKHKGDNIVVEKWVKSIQRNIHQHDVRAMVSIGKKIFSCGIDGYLAMSSFPPKLLVKYPSIHPQTAVQFVSGTKLIRLQYTNSVEIWELGSASPQQNGRESFSPVENSLDITDEMKGEKETGADVNTDNNTARRLRLAEGPRLLLRLNGPSGTPIICSAISNNQKWIAYSTESHLRIFKYSMMENSPTLSRLMPLPEECIPCYRMCFAPDSNSLIIGTANAQIIIFHIHTDGAVLVGCKIETENVLTNRALTNLVVSESIKNKYYIAVSDDISNIGIWSVDYHDDYSKANLITTLPKYKYSPCAITFNNKENTVLVAYADQKLIEYNLKKLRLTKWSEFIGNKETLGSKWWSRLFPIAGLAIHPHLPNVIMAYDDCGIYVINKNAELDEKPISKKSKKLSANKDSRLPYVIKKYKHLVGAGWSTSETSEVEASLVIVEPTSLLEKLPPAFFKKRFGCM